MTNINQRMTEMLKSMHKKGSSIGGVDALVKVLNQCDRATEKQLLHSLKQQNPELAEEISKKYFAFEDLLHMEDAVLKKALSEVHRSTLALALKGTDETVREKVMRNLSKRAAEMLRDDMDFMGPKERDVVEAAQREVTKTLRRWKNVIL